MKLIRTLFLALVGSFLIVSALPTLVHACDPLGCLVNGKDQDALVLVTIQRVEKDQALARVEHTHSQKRFSYKTQLTIRLEQETTWGLSSPKVGEHYFISLACPDTTCQTKWGAWQVDRADFATAKLLQIRNGDDAAIQWLMNGNGSDFYGDSGKMFARTAQGDVEIYPNYPAVVIPGKSLFFWLSRFLLGIGITFAIVYIVIQRHVFPSKKH